MFRYISRRIMLMLLALIVIITMTFFLLQLMDGYPAAISERLLTSENPDAILAGYDFTDNAFIKFFKYIGGILQGDFGTYYTFEDVKITTLFLGPLKYTFMITVPAFLLGSFFGVLFGFIAGYKRGKWPDVAVNIFAIIFVSIPSFILAIVLMLIGRDIGLPIEFVGDKGTLKMIASLFLPILILTLGSFATLTYYVRNEVVEVLISDYVSIARAKGLSEPQILFKHVMRNVSIPMVTILLPRFIFMISGSFIIEQFFGVPGSSSIFVTAVQRKEVNVVMFSVMFFSILSLSTQIIVDISYVLLDPRIKMANSQQSIIFASFIAFKFRKHLINMENPIYKTKYICKTDIKTEYSKLKESLELSKVKYLNIDESKLESEKENFSNEQQSLKNKFKNYKLSRKTEMHSKISVIKEGAPK